MKIEFLCKFSGQRGRGVTVGVIPIVEIKGIECLARIICVAKQLIDFDNTIYRVKLGINFIGLL